MRWFEACPCRPASGGQTPIFNTASPASPPVFVAHETKDHRSTLAHALIGQPINLLEQQQPDCRPRRNPGPDRVAIKRGDLADKVPVDLAGELCQFVLEVDDLLAVLGTDRPISSHRASLVASFSLRCGNRKSCFAKKTTLAQRLSRCSRATKTEAGTRQRAWHCEGAIICFRFHRFSYLNDPSTCSAAAL